MKNKYIEAINLKNKITIITGSSGYLGQMIANTYAELGSNLILIDKRRINFSLMKKKYKEKYNVNIYYKKCDLEKEKDRKKLITWIKNNFKKIDVLVNNAAMTGASKNSDYSEKFNKQSLATWNRALNINLTSVFDLVTIIELTFSNNFSFAFGFNCLTVVINCASVSLAPKL